MPEKKDDMHRISPEEFFQELEAADVYLPVQTETTSVSPESRVVVYSSPRSAGADRFRLLQMRLRNLRASRQLKVLLITSPLPGDGKTTVALNLATALTERGKRPVLLLESDVYRPTMAKKLNLKPWMGVTDCFEGGLDPMQAIRRIEPLGFYLLPAGTPVDDGSRILQSEYIAHLIKGLAASSFDWILVDAPPTTPIAEILALQAQSDGTLLVARAQQTPREAIEESTRNLGRDHVVGIVLNEVQGLDRVYSHYYGYTNPEDRARRQKRGGPQGLGLKS
jgi:capsular exopolysaccharide synthesis family protein